MVLSFFGIWQTESSLAEQLGTTQTEGTSFTAIERLLRFYGIGCNRLSITSKHDAEVSFSKALEKGPVIAALNRFVYDQKTPRINSVVRWEKDEYSLHSVLVIKMEQGRVIFLDPHIQIGKITIPQEVFLESFWSHKNEPLALLVENSDA